MEAILIGVNGENVPLHVMAEVNFVLVIVPIRRQPMVALLALDWATRPKLEHATTILALLVFLKLDYESYEKDYA